MASFYLNHVEIIRTEQIVEEQTENPYISAVELLLDKIKKKNLIYRLFNKVS